MNESNEVADLYFAIPSCLLSWRWLRRKVEPDPFESSWTTLFVNLMPFSLDQKERRWPREDWDDSPYGFGVAGRTSSSGMQMSGANRNCPLRRPFLHRSDWTLVSDWKRFAGRTGIICETGEVKRSHRDIRSLNDETCRTSLGVHRSRRFHFTIFDMEIISISTSNRWWWDVYLSGVFFLIALVWFIPLRGFPSEVALSLPISEDFIESLVGINDSRWSVRWGRVSSRSFYLSFCSANIHCSCIDGSGYSIQPPSAAAVDQTTFFIPLSCTSWTG